MRGPLLDVHPRSWAQSLISERYRGEWWGLGDIQGYTINLIFTGWTGSGAVRHHLEELSSFHQYLERDYLRGKAKKT